MGKDWQIDPQLVTCSNAKLGNLDAFGPSELYASQPEPKPKERHLVSVWSPESMANYESSQSRILTTSEEKGVITNQLVSSSYSSWSTIYLRSSSSNPPLHPSQTHPLLVPRSLRVAALEQFCGLKSDAKCMAQLATSSKKLRRTTSTCWSTGSPWCFSYHVYGIIWDPLKIYEIVCIILNWTIGSTSMT